MDASDVIKGVYNAGINTGKPFALSFTADSHPPIRVIFTPTEGGRYQPWILQQGTTVEDINFVRERLATILEIDLESIQIVPPGNIW